MHHKLKERLFGGVVLVALGIIFIPMVFDQSIPAEVSPQSAIPDAPDWSADVEVSVPEHWVVSEQETQEHEQSVIFNLASERARPHLQSDAPESKVVENDALAAAREKLAANQVVRKVWAIQLASFEEEQNAEDLAYELRRNGYPAYTKKFKQEDKDISRVLIGPEIDKREAQNLQGILKSKFNLEGIVIPFDPVSG